MIRIKIDLVGTSPLLMHNERLADPKDEYTRRIKALTDKRTRQTDTDREQVERLKWEGALYYNDGAPLIPVNNIRATLVEVGAIKRLKQQFLRGVSRVEPDVKLIYTGPTRVDEMYADPQFIDRRMVGVNGKRIVGIRPRFMPWAVSAEFFVLEDVISLESVAWAAETAGVAVGLCDGRKIGMGRFTATVTELGNV